MVWHFKTIKLCKIKGGNKNEKRKQKLSVLHQLGIHVGKEIFETATTEIQVDNIARSLILG